MESAKGACDPKMQAVSSSTLVFEWSFGKCGQLHREVVRVRCADAIQRGVPAPVAAGKIQSRTIDLKSIDFEALAVAAVASDKCQAIRRNLGDPSTRVICRRVLDI